MRLVAALVTVNALWIVWANRFLPLSDYPDYVYEGWILSQKMRGVQFKHYLIKHYAFTHAAVPLLCSLLNFVVSPETSAKIVLSLAIVMFVAGSAYMLGACGATEHSQFFYIPLLYVFNSWFFWGEIDFYIGFVGFLFFAGYVLRRRDHPETVAPAIILIALCLIFVAHLMAYLACLAVVAGILWAQPKGASSRAILWPSLASVSLLVWYVAGRIAGHQLGGQQIYDPWTLRALAANFIDAFALFHIFLPWVNAHSSWMHAAGAINLIAALGILGMLCACLSTLFQKGSENDAAPLWAILLCIVAYGAGGRSIFGVFGAERFGYPAAWLAMSWAAARWKPAGARALGIAMSLLLAIQICALNVQVRSASSGLTTVYDKLKAAGSHSEFCSIYETYYKQTWAEPKRPGFERFLPNHQNTVRLPYYLDIERGASAPIFDAGIFNYRGPGNPSELCQ